MHKRLYLINMVHKEQEKGMKPARNSLTFIPSEQTKPREDDRFSTSSHSAAHTCVTQLHVHSTPPLTVHGHKMYGHTCSMTPVDLGHLFSRDAGSNEPQGPYLFPYSVGLMRVVESEGGVRVLAATAAGLRVA